MIIHDVPQGSDCWFSLRLGRPTASSFDKIITPTGKASTQADAYANMLVAEWLTGQPGGMEPNAWMQRGTDMEPEARSFYEMDADAEVEQVGFLTRDDGWVGCSPDGLVGGDGLLEIKCPSPAVHVEYLLNAEIPGKYKPQVQGQLLIAERDWCDFLSYHPDMPPVRIRVERDEAFIKALSGRLDALVEAIQDKRERLTKRGIEPTYAAAA